MKAHCPHCEDQELETFVKAGPERCLVCHQCGRRYTSESDIYKVTR